MADLFTRLAQRAHGQQQILAPRRLARFETVEPQPDWWRGGEVEMTADLTAAPPVVLTGERGRRRAQPDLVAPAVRDLAATAVPPRTPRRDDISASGSSDSVDPPHVSQPAAPVGVHPPDLHPVAATKAPPHSIRPHSPAPATGPHRETSARTAAFGGDTDPDVHITIGRIEIRATTPPAAPVISSPAAAGPREPAEPHRLSLAAYLRGESAGPR